MPRAMARAKSSLCSTKSLASSGLSMKAVSTKTAGQAVPAKFAQSRNSKSLITKFIGIVTNVAVDADCAPKALLVPVSCLPPEFGYFFVANRGLALLKYSYGCDKFITCRILESHFSRAVIKVLFFIITTFHNAVWC